MDDTQTSRDEDFSPECSSTHQRGSEPEPSCVSMKSDWSMGLPIEFKSGDIKIDLGSIHQRGSEPEPSCVSMKSDWSMGLPIEFKSGDIKIDLELRYCGVTKKGCAALTSALRLSPSHLRELSLSGNKIGQSVNLLSDVLQDPHCKLKKLWLSDCGVTDEGCAALTSALRSNPSHLRELSLSWNKIGQSVNLLSDVLQDPHCKLEKLWLRYCGVTNKGCAALTSALRSNPSHLRELDLSGNKIGQSINLLSDVLQDPHCKLERLWLSDCGVTDEGCAALTSALRLNPSHLTELDLSGNKIGQSVNLLSDVLQDPHCKLERLWLRYCLHLEGCAALASALRSSPSHLRQLSLTENKLGNSGVKLLSDLKDDPNYKLKELKY